MPRISSSLRRPSASAVRGGMMASHRFGSYVDPHLAAPRPGDRSPAAISRNDSRHAAFGAAAGRHRGLTVESPSPYLAPPTRSVAAPATSRVAQSAEQRPEPAARTLEGMTARWSDPHRLPGPGRVGEGRRPPPRPVALDREAPPGERAVQGGGRDDGAAGVDPGAAAAGAGGLGSPGQLVDLPAIGVGRASTPMSGERAAVRPTWVRHERHDRILRCRESGRSSRRGPHSGPRPGPAPAARPQPGRPAAPRRGCSRSPRRPTPGTGARSTAGTTG